MSWNGSLLFVVGLSLVIASADARANALNLRADKMSSDWMLSDIDPQQSLQSHSWGSDWLSLTSPALIAHEGTNFALPWGVTTYPGTIRSGFDLTIAASGTQSVLNLNDFVLTGGTLTLEGSAGQSFVINVADKFSLSGDAKIVLSGGLAWDDVVFNVLGTGKDVVLRQRAEFTGILNAQFREVRLRGYATVYGDVESPSIHLRGLAQIIQPPVTSP